MTGTADPADDAILAPEEVAAGPHGLIVENEEEDAGHAFIFRVPDDVS